MGNKEKSELMLTGKYYLKCEHTPCKCIDLESCDNSVLMEKRLPDTEIKKIILYEYEIYSENFSSIVISDSLIGAATEFNKNNPDEHIIFAENIKFRNVDAAQLIKQEQQGNINNDAWVSVSDLPPECTVVLGYNEKWIDDDFEPEGIRESFYNDGDWCSAVWNNEQDCWDTDWEAKPTYWMQRPSPPNQKLNH